MSNNLKSYFNKKRFWAGILLAQFLFFLTASKIEFVIHFFDRFFELQKSAHQQLFSFIPFSIGDLFYVALGGTLVFFLFKIIKKKYRQRNLLRILVILNIIYFSYQIFWGMLYFQKPLLEKLPEHQLETTEIKHLTLRYLKNCKNSRELVTEDEKGVFMITDLNSVKDEILLKQGHLPAFLNEKKRSEVRSFKPSTFRGIMNYTGILGYYNPFTAEAQYNADLPPTYIPFTLAHESSHQLGYAREQEANFIGFLIGEQSTNLDLRYSTQYFVLKSLLNSLVRDDPEFVRQVLTNYSSGMQRDRIAERAFRKKHEGFLDIFFGITNDLFLKSNQQEGSITYSYFIDLLIRYEASKNKSLQ